MQSLLYCSSAGASLRQCLQEKKAQLAKNSSTLLDNYWPGISLNTVRDIGDFEFKVPNFTTFGVFKL